MTNLTDEKILEFIHAGEGWFWDDDPNKTYQAAPSTLEFKRIFPFVARFKHGGCRDFKNFSLTKPQVYEDGKWYAAKIDVDNFSHFRKGSEILCLYKHDLFITVNNINDTSSFHEKCLTNIRPIPPGLWEGEG